MKNWDELTGSRSRNGDFRVSKAAGRVAFRDFVRDLANELPAATGLPCHLRRVRVALRMRGNVSAYAQPALSRLSFSRTTRKYVEQLLTHTDESASGELLDRTIEQAEVIAHELLHLRFSASEAEKNMAAEELFPGLDAFEEALTTVLSRKAVPYVLARLGIHGQETAIELRTPRERANDYEYVIVPLLSHVLEAAAHKEGTTEDLLLHRLGAASSTLEAAHLLFQPFLAGTRIEQAHVLRELLGVFSCAADDLETYLKSVESGRERLSSLDDVEERCRTSVALYAGTLDGILRKFGKPTVEGRRGAVILPGSGTIH